jgi:hypothetical protein
MLIKTIGSSPDKSKIWECRCECGRTCEKTHQQLSRSKNHNCNALYHGNRKQKLCPPTPNPLPDRATEILQEYMPRLSRFRAYLDAEDRAWVALQRAAYVIQWREEQGYPIESPGAYIEKMFYTIAMLSRAGKIRTTKPIGSTMTNERSNDQELAKAETTPEEMLPKKVRSFRRC